MAVFGFFVATGLAHFDDLAADQPDFVDLRRSLYLPLLPADLTTVAGP